MYGVDRRTYLARFTNSNISKSVVIPAPDRPTHEVKPDALNNSTVEGSYVKITTSNLNTTLQRTKAGRQRRRVRLRPS